ncbi:MAG TPA: class I SAM-dependent methyltransferase [Vicinamibacterales bacterium]|nr:class I SAM-dependent methyltransferase [Vicinamibacterales bacterium]
MHPLYSDRPLAQGYPDLDKQAVAAFHGAEGPSRVPEIMACLERLIDLSAGSRKVAVVGCGPDPQSVKDLLARGYDAVGIEPVPGFAKQAAEALDDGRRIHIGTAESLALPDQSQRVVLLESVLEHVDSPRRALTEAFRVLVPGGVLYVYTTNRLRFSPRGDNGEFVVRFYNWFPALVKECYVYKHLHFDPRLANHSLRPAVHWFTFAELCRLGRQAGFAHFYSLIDLVDSESPSVKRGLFRRWLVRHCRYHPWLRALGLMQFGSSIFMLKRPEHA